MRFLIQSFIDNLIDIIYINKCIICNSKNLEDTKLALCKTCAKDVDYMSNYPHKIYKGIPIYSATIYSKTIKKLICLYFLIILKN